MSAARCPLCNARAKCMDSRPSGKATRRRYYCACGHRYTTAEIAVTLKSGSEAAGDLADKIASAMKLRKDLRVLVEDSSP